MVRHRHKRREKAELLRLRKVIAEPSFAWIKRHQDFWRWTVRGLANVRRESYIINAEGVPGVHPRDAVDVASIRQVQGAPPCRRPLYAGRVLCTALKALAAGGDGMIPARPG